MIKIVYSILLLCFFIPPKTDTINLKIVITNLENSSGHIIMDLRDGNDKEIMTFKEVIINNCCIIIAKDLIPGKYSFKYFHDENDNNKMDTYWIGAPKEGIGFSNNASVKYGQPGFEETVFEIRNDTTLNCKAYYFSL